MKCVWSKLTPLRSLMSNLWSKLWTSDGCIFRKIPESHFERWVSDCHRSVFDQAEQKRTPLEKGREGLPHFTLLWKIFTTRSLSLLLSEECLKSINANRVPFQLGMFLLLYPYVTWTLAKQIDFIWKHNWEKVWPTFDYGISHKKAGKIWSTF